MFPPLALVVPIQELIYGLMWRKDPSRSRGNTAKCGDNGGRAMGKHRELRDECKGKNAHCALLKGEKHEFFGAR